jgi:peptidoglycan-associated lipoprotein
MKVRIPRVTLVLVAAIALLAAGCARKQQEAPPAPPPTPPQTTPTTPPPAPPAQPETPSAPQLTSGDFRPAFFDYDSAVLRSDARSVLDANAKLLRDNAGANVTIEGHCDERGTVEYNQALGEQRAMAARDYLVAAGISASRIQVVSYGKERPFDSGHDESAWAQNRRAHFVLR